MGTKAKPAGEACCAGAKMVVLNDCQIEAILTVDARGQMVLPKEVRDLAGIKPGDKLGLVTLQKSREFCCMLLVKADALAGQVKNIVGPIVVSGPKSNTGRSPVRKGRA